MNQIRVGDWMQTHGGRQFWPLDPHPEEIDIEDIAAALSKLCRYGGHCLRFYSVAEHCVHVASAARASLAMTALLHDASEAYLSDVIRPIKSRLTNYVEIEAALERAIAVRFGTVCPMPEEVKRLDNAILWTEMLQNMAPPPEPWTKWLTDAPLDITLQFWAPDKAEAEFLTAFRRYGA
jgi:hypothetical protein